MPPLTTGFFRPQRRESVEASSNTRNWNTISTMTLEDPENLSATVASAPSDRGPNIASRSRRLSESKVAPGTVTPEHDPNHGRNFTLVSFYQVILRIGWIFKTESIIMPAVLDVIGGAGWLRGCLPMLNRFGQSIPPLLVSDVVRNSPRKKIGLSMTTLLMGVCFLALALIWAVTGGQKSWWLPVVFLVIYGVFFSATGMNQLFLNTISGKLIKFDFRGRLALVSTVIGSTLAVISAWYLLRIWLGGTNSTAEGGAANFTMIFAFTGCAFVLAAVVSLTFKEPVDSESRKKRSGVALLRSSVSTIANDHNFRTLTIIGALFGMSLTLFPHYQALARGRLSLGLTALIPWVIAQNIGAALFSIPAGWIADRFGNRLVLRMAMLGLCLAPILSLILARLGDAGQPWFTAVFCLLGLTPVTFRILNNYTLEVTHTSEHPRYLSTLSLVMAGPAILTSAFFGALIDWVSFEFVFGIVVICVFCGWLLTFRLEEPRHVN